MMIITVPIKKMIGNLGWLTNKTDHIAILKCLNISRIINIQSGQGLPFLFSRAQGEEVLLKR
jgi:hypothetical protein